MPLLAPTSGLGAECLQLIFGFSFIDMKRIVCFGIEVKTIFVKLRLLRRQKHL
jgi:hypothetical protein